MISDGLSPAKSSPIDESSCSWSRGASQASWYCSTFDQSTAPASTTTRIPPSTTRRARSSTTAAVSAASGIAGDAVANALPAIHGVLQWFSASALADRADDVERELGRAAAHGDRDARDGRGRRDEDQHARGRELRRVEAEVARGPDPGELPGGERPHEVRERVERDDVRVQEVAEHEQ